MEKRIREYHPFNCPRCDHNSGQYEVNYNYSDDEFTSTYECPECGQVWTNRYAWVATELEGVTAER